MRSPTSSFSSSSSSEGATAGGCVRASRLRRTAYLFFYAEDGRFLDIPALLAGTVELAPVRQLYVISILSGQVYALTEPEFTALLSVPSDHWIALDDAEKAGLHPPAAEVFASRGIVLADGNVPEWLEFRRKDEQLAATNWNIFAALYHFLTRWQGVQVQSRFESNEPPDSGSLRSSVLDAFVDAHGPPPPHFAETEAADSVGLPLVLRDDGLYGVLSKRRTTRALDPDVPLPIEELALLLYYGFGCHGYLRLRDNVVALKRTSPSGGGLHPTEVYPLVLNVDGLNPGLYHYNARQHALEEIEPLERGVCGALAQEFTAGQSYPPWAQVLFIMTARFARSFWKYQRHDKAYSVGLMDAAHISQSLYLICADRGLGAFVTAAINSVDIERRLGLDGVTEGAVLVAGCGSPLAQNRLDPEYLPYTPGKTKI